MNYQKFTEVREGMEQEPDQFTATVDMDEVVIITREPFHGIDCLRFFLKHGWTLYIGATPEAIEIVKDLVK